jgi:hypothetical protein
MGAQLLAGEYAGAVCNLEAIARHYVGRHVTVRFQAAATWLGLARRTEAGPEIFVNPAACAADLGYILFHEIGHLVRGHVTLVDATPAADLAQDDRAARLERLTPPERAALCPVLDKMEAEADEWAWAALAAFEGRFGPFLEALTC